MGCRVSRIGGNGMTYSERLRPVFLSRLEDIAIRGHNNHVYDSTLSKKNLLSYDSISSKGSKLKVSFGEDSARLGIDDKETKGKHFEKSKEEVSYNENCNATWIGNQSESNVPNEITSREEGNNVKPEYEEDDTEDIFLDCVSDDSNDNGDDDFERGRMISHMDDEPYIGSPSFRIYYKDNGEDEDELEKIGENNAIKDVDEDVVVKESYGDEKVTKRNRKKRSLKKILAKGFSVKSCYTRSNASRDRTHLLT